MNTETVMLEELLVGTEKRVRRRRLHSGEPSDPAPGRDADRLLRAGSLYLQEIFRLRSPSSE